MVTLQFAVVSVKEREGVIANIRGKLAYAGVASSNAVTTENRIIFTLIKFTSSMLYNGKGNLFWTV